MTCSQKNSHGNERPAWDGMDLSAAQRFLVALVNGPKPSDSAEVEFRNLVPEMSSDDYMVWIFDAIERADSNDEHRLVQFLSDYRSPEYRFLVFPAEQGVAMAFGLYHFEPDNQRSPNYIGNRMDFWDHQMWFAQELIEEAQQTCGLRLKCLLGRPSAGICGLYQSYHEMIWLARYHRMFCLEKPIMKFRDFEQMESNVPSRNSIVAMLESFTTSFKAGRYALAEDSVVQLFDRCFVQAIPSRDMTMQLLPVVLGHIMAVFYMYAPVPEPCHMLWTAGKMDSAVLPERFTLRDYLDGLHHFLEQMPLYPIDSSQEDRTSWIPSMMQYIDNHISDRDMTLTTLAAHFQLAPSHISRAIKQKYGKGLLEQIQEKRLAAAIGLMGTSLTLQEIADQCGFASARAMRNTFLKFKNMTPSDYRSSMEQQNPHIPSS